MAHADLVGNLLEHVHQAKDRTRGRLAEGGVIEVSMQCPIQSLDPFRSSGSEVSQGARLHLAVFAKRLPEKDGRGRSAIGNPRNIHAYNSPHKMRLLPSFQILTSFERGKFRRAILSPRKAPFRSLYNECELSCRE